MNDVEIADFRRKRLLEAIEHVSTGDRTAFARRLGYKDGAFIRQMLSGTRAISERTVNKIERLPGMRGWFSLPVQSNLEVQNTNIECLQTKAGYDVARKYVSASGAAQRVIDLVLLREHGSSPIWAPKALISAVETAVAIAELALQPPADRPKRARR